MCTFVGGEGFNVPGLAVPNLNAESTTLLAFILLDAAEHTILRKLADANELPALASLRSRGSLVPIRSDAHRLDGGVFQTLLTGVSPAKHGIYKYQQLVPGTYRYQRSKAVSSPVPQVWRILSDRGHRCCVFDVAKAFPIDGFHGSLVASWGSYTPAGDPASSPAELLQAVLRRFGPHPQRFQKPLPLLAREYPAILDRLQKAARTRTDICLWMLEQSPCDVFMTSFSEPHVACHQFWHLRDPGHPMFDPAAADLCSEAIEDVYRAVDAGLARLLEALPDDATIVLLAQQGVQNNYSGSQLLPHWLARREGLTPRQATTPWLIRAGAALGSPLRLFIFSRLPESVGNRLSALRFQAKTDVFMMAGSEYAALLRVNLQGREPAGTVSRDAYRATIDGLVEDLLALRNPATGQPAVQEILLPQEEWSGPLVDTLPDVVVHWANDKPIDALECPRFGAITDAQEFADVTHSSHTGEGVAIVAGPSIAHGEIGTPHDVRDINATLYDLLGEEIPEHIEGKPIQFSPTLVSS